MECAGRARERMNNAANLRVAKALFHASCILCILIDLIRTRAAEVVVITPDAPPPVVLFSEQEEEYYGERVRAHEDAAWDLCDYLSRVTGREIRPGAMNPDAPMNVHVGPDDFALQHAPEIRDLHADGFLLRHVNVDGAHHLILGGIRSLSSRWAVEDFLEKYAGVRWLFPGDAKYGEIVPSKSSISIAEGLDEIHEPDYISRPNCMMHYYVNGGNYLRGRPTESWGYGSHEFQSIFSRDDFEAHPEWFGLFTIPERWAESIGEGRTEAADRVREALLRGERRGRWHWDYGNGWQICTSNPEGVRHAAAYARDFFETHTGAPVVSMGHNDMHGWCECELCATFIASADPPYTHSEQYWHWVNQVAKELSVSNPDRKITTIAYGAPASPPRFELEPNVSVMLTVYVESHLDLARKWQEKASTVDIYSYPWGSEFLGFRHYPHAMRDFLKWGHDELGAISHSTEVYGNWSFDGPKYKYMQALQWDVNADPDHLMDEYCRDWFGAAATPMRAFWDRHEEIYERRGDPRRILFYQWIGWHKSYDEFDFHTLDDVQVLDRAIEEAERAAGTESDRFRVARVADAWRYTRAFLLGKLKFADREDEVLQEARASRERAQELAEELAAHQSQRNALFRQLRAYPGVREPRPPQELTRRSQQLGEFNPQMTRDYYLLTFELVTLFADLRTILHDLCERITTHAGGEAESFWSSVQRDDPLYDSAQTQLAILRRAAPTNLLVNGNFESGGLDGWETTGEIGVDTERFAARVSGPVTISQRVPVRPGERYRLTVPVTYDEPGAATLSTDVRFKGRARPRYEPNYRKLSTADPAGQRNALRTVFTVPMQAETAKISIESSGSSAWFDDVTLERLQEGPVIEPGMIADEFSGNHVNQNVWQEAVVGRSGALPIVADGALLFDSEPGATLISLASFDELLTGRYRLRLHVSRGDDRLRDGFLECGGTTDTVPLQTDDSGLYLAYGYTAPGVRQGGSAAPWPNAEIRTYWHQDGTFVGGGNFNVPLNHADHELWYTIDFESKMVSIFAGHDGFDDGAEARLGRYEHGMADIASKGAVFLKLSGSNVRVHEISLVRSEN